MLKKCPQCGSSDIIFFVGGEAGQIYECKSCGYRGTLIIEADDIGKSMKEDLKQLKGRAKH